MIRKGAAFDSLQRIYNDPSSERTADDVRSLDGSL